MKLYTEIISVVIIFSSGLCVLNAIVQAARWRYGKRHLAASAVLVVHASIFLRVGLYDAAWISDNPFASFLFITSLLLAGPLSLANNFFSIDQDKTLPFSMKLFFIPAAIVFFAELYFQSRPYSFKSQMLICDLSAPMTSIIGILLALSSLYDMSFHVYLSIKAFRLGISKKRGAIYFSASAHAVGVICIFTTIVGFLSSNEALVKTGGLINGLIYVFDYIIRYSYPEPFREIRRMVKRQRYERSLAVNGVESEIIFKRLEELMADEKIYRDFDLDLNRAAEMLFVKRHNLSQILNSHKNTTFKDYLNNYRIEEAKRLLEKDPGQSVISICYNVGFNTKSHFNLVFKRYTGITPTEYRNARN
jgi:AraC-like DNA-binding protein